MIYEWLLWSQRYWRWIDKLCIWTGVGAFLLPHPHVPPRDCTSPQILKLWDRSQLGCWHDYRGKVIQASKNTKKLLYFANHKICHVLCSKKNRTKYWNIDLWLYYQPPKFMKNVSLYHFTTTARWVNFTTFKLTSECHQIVCQEVEQCYIIILYNCLISTLYVIVVLQRTGRVSSNEAWTLTLHWIWK